MEPVWQTGDALSFGPFILVPGQRLLTNNGAPVDVGARALDILITLVSRPNEPVSKRELITRVWPDVRVGEGSLRFHVANLRKALGDGERGARYITTLSGRGYAFVAPVSRSHDPAPVHVPTLASAPRTNVPGRLERMVGRCDGVRIVSTQLAATRFVTIVGAGGVGKTTVAVAVAHRLIEAFGSLALFVDFGTLNNASLVASSLAAMLGLSVQADDPTPNLVAYLRDKRYLLVFDNCEHLILAVALLAARIFAAAPQVHILATSREALRAEGEHIHRLEPLACPTDGPALTAEVALTYPAVQLFVDRVAASGVHLDLNNSDAVIVANICRKLDGLALAIELAAARVEAFGLHQTAALVEERLALLWQGHRTAPPRQQTLKAMLDWSYELLTDLEKQVLRQLAVFVGDFTLGAALAVLTSAALDQIQILGAIENLVAKSIVATTRVGSTMHYKLPDTTRAFVIGIGDDEAGSADLGARHAAYYRRWLEQTAAERATMSLQSERTPELAHLGNVRAALEWCYGANGDSEIGIALAAAAAPYFLTMSLLTECHRWSDRAIKTLGDDTRGGREEMHLQAALGTSLMFTRGESETARAALLRSLAIAEDCDDAGEQLHLLGALHMFHGRIGDFGAALLYAERGSAISRTIADPAALAFGHRLLGIALHHAGDLPGARRELEAAPLSVPRSQQTSTAYVGFDDSILVDTGLARTLWLQGHPVQAVERARQAVSRAAELEHPVTLSMALVWAIFVYLWTGDFESADKHTDWLMSCAESHSLEPYLAVGRGFKGQMAVHQGNAQRGVEDLHNCLAKLHAASYELLTTLFNISLVEGLAAIGRLADGIRLIEETIKSVEVNGDFCYMPELLRVKGCLLRSMPQPGGDNAEQCFMQSLEFSRRQGARAWELRTAVDLAALLAAQGRHGSARSLLQPVFMQFAEGADTADLKAAASLLATLA